MSQLDNTIFPARFKLRVLGTPSLTDADDTPLPGMGPGKPLAMLTYIVLSGQAPRNELVALLWPEMPEDRARNAFRQTLHRLRGVLGHDLLRTDRDTVSIAPTTALWCDAIEFAAALGSDPERAISLYRGPFLGGLDVGSNEFEQWADAQRERMDVQHRAALAAAAELALEAGRSDSAAKHAAVLSRIAPLDPDAAVLEARILAGSGRKPEAVSVLTQHAQRVEAEFGSKPATAVSSMLRRLLNDALSAPPAAAGSGTSDQLIESEFVGREKELGKLLALWRGIQGRGATATLTGPPGIGKSRLVAEVAQRVQAFGPGLILWGQERQGNRSIPYAALADALRPAVSAPGLAGASQHLLAEAARLLPEIRDRFELPDAGALEDETARIRFFEGVAALLDAVAYEQPVCVIVEDMHHSSMSSARLLHFLTTRLRKAPVLFILSYRTAEAPPHVLDRFGLPRASAGTAGSFSPVPHVPVELRPLPADAVVRMIASVGASAELDADLLTTIVAMAEGNPFRALDLVRRARRGESFDNLPSELAPALWARLQSCSPHEQRLFLACSLLERPAPLRLLSAATHLPEPATFDAAVALEQRGLVVQRRGGIAPAHDVLAALALEGTGSAGRALLAGWTADALASQPGASNAELARLYGTAGQPSSAHRYARAAVLDAAASGAGDELEALLSLATETAVNNEDRKAVASLRSAFGRGVRRISGGHDMRARATPPSGPAPTTQEKRRHPRLARHLLSPRIFPIAAGIALIALASAALYRAQERGAGVRGTVLKDSVVVTERIGARGSSSYVVTGPILPAAVLAGYANAPVQPPWARELQLPWVNPRTSPDGKLVALERITSSGTAVYVVSADRGDTTAVATAAGDNVVAGWSPDSRWLLVIHGSEASGRYRSSLRAVLAARPAVTAVLDSVPTHAIVDAVWSPLGPHVAWTARTGDGRDQDVFVSLSDGTGRRNVSASPAEDYHPAWSPDGKQIAFTSERDGNAELYSIELDTGALRRLTFDAAHDDQASYSPDGDFIAFESTRAGRTGVYAMPPLGGTAVRLTPVDRNFALARWRGPDPSYVTRLNIQLPDVIAEGQRVELSATGVDQSGSSVDLPAVDWALLDATSARLTVTADTIRGTRTTFLQAKRRGLVRVIAGLGAWRVDTGFTVVGNQSVAIVDDDFSRGLSASTWLPLGSPRPQLAAGADGRGGNAVMLRAGRRWETGILSTAVIPLRQGLTVTARIRAPFDSRGLPGGFTLALVAAESPELIDHRAPQFLKVAALSWLPEAGRLAYAAEREFWSEPVTFARGNDWHAFRIEVRRDGRVAFYVEDRLRRKSSVVVTGPEGALHVQLWLAARATGDEILVDDVGLTLQGRN